MPRLAVGVRESRVSRFKIYKMKHGSLFSGIGGFDLAAQWAGWDNVFQCEIDPFCQKVLQKNFPNVYRHSDIHSFDGKKWRGVDVVSGGFPCQPYSTAGSRKGNDDDRALWPEMFRVVREIAPRWVVGENVAGLISMDGGRVLDGIFTDLESIGYSVEAFVIPAIGVGAPHRRKRIWIVAYSEKVDDRRNAGEVPKENGRQKWNNVPKFGGTNQVPSWDEHYIGAAPKLCRMDDGIPDRMDRIEALGNAIIPGIAYNLFSMINNVG